MAKQILNIGAAPNDGNGDPLRDAMDKVNDNFNEIYTALGGDTVTNLVNSGTLELTGSNKITFLYNDLVDLPSASSYHGMFAHVHNAGAAYYAHAGSWIQLADKSQVDNLSINNLIDVDTASNAPTNGQVLKWNSTNSAWEPANDANDGSVALTDFNVTVNSAGTANLAYNNTTGTFTYTPPDLSGYQLASSAFDGDYNSLTNKPTIPSVLTDLGITDGTNGQVLTTDGAGNFTFSTVTTGSTYGDSDVDTHLNTSTATSGQILSWDGADYAWVADQTSAGGTDTVIAPFAFANVETTADGSGTGISWSNWNSGNGSLDFTFDNAQANTQYTVVTDSETFDDYSVGISNKTTTGFTAEFYDNSGTRVPSNFSPFTIIVYAETPTATITGTSLSNASIGALSDVSISSATTGQVLKYNGSSWVNDTDTGGAEADTLATVTARGASTTDTLVLTNGAEIGNAGSIVFETENDPVAWSNGSINTQDYSYLFNFPTNQSAATAPLLIGWNDRPYLKPFLETSIGATEATQGVFKRSISIEGGNATETRVPGNVYLTFGRNISAATFGDIIIGNAGAGDIFIGKDPANNTSHTGAISIGGDNSSTALRGAVDFTNATVTGLSSSSDTLADVTARGASTNDAVTINNTLTVDALDSTGIGFANLTSASDIVLSAVGDINASSSKITNVLDPTANQDAATKAYVDTNVASAGSPTFSVTAPDSARYQYSGDGFPTAQDNPTLYLYKGFTYTFNLNVSGHPFHIQTSSGAYNASNLYTDGITNAGAQTGTMTFTVPMNAPATLYYVCQYHSAMNGTITIV